MARIKDERLKGYLNKKKIDSAFLKRLYTSEELRYCFSKARPPQHLAGRFAAKESVKKALAPLLKQPIDFKDIEIINNESDIPTVLMRSSFENKFSFSLSISHIKNIALAVVIAIQKNKSNL